MSPTSAPERLASSRALSSSRIRARSDPWSAHSSPGSRSTGSSVSGPRAGKVLVPPLEYDPNTGDGARRAGRGRAGRHGRLVDLGRRTHAEASARPSVRVRADHARRRRHRDGARGRRRQHRPHVDRHARATAVARRSAQHDRRPRVLGARMTDASTPKENLVMNHLVSLTYSEELTPILERYVDALIDGRIVGHKCPQCGRVYVPGKGYCPICVVPTTDKRRVRGQRPRDRHRLHDHHAGRVLRPDRDRAVRVRVGAARRFVGQPRRPGHRRCCRTTNCTPACGCGRCGSRPSERNAEGVSNRGWGSVASVIDAFEWTGEPDADRSVYEEHIF